MPEVLCALFPDGTSPTGVFGAKAHWPQFQDILADPVLQDMLRVILIVQTQRRDTETQAVSLAVAESTGRWINFEQEQRGLGSV